MGNINELSKSAQIKADLGERIVEICREHGKNLHMVRAAGENARDLKPKIIVEVNDAMEAEELQKRLKSAVDTFNAMLKGLLGRALKNENEYVPIKYKTSIINGYDVVLSTTMAHSAKRMKKKDLIAFAENEYHKARISIMKNKGKDEPLTDFEEEFLSDYKNDVAVITNHPGQIFLVHEYTGNAYRITYFDEQSNRRKQVSLGNVSIVYTANDHEINFREDRRERKKRTDATDYALSITKTMAVFEL